METTIHLMVRAEPLHTPTSRSLVVMHTLTMMKNGLQHSNGAEVPQVFRPQNTYIFGISLFCLWKYTNNKKIKCVIFSINLLSDDTIKKLSGWQLIRVIIRKGQNLVSSADTHLSREIYNYLRWYDSKDLYKSDIYTDHTGIPANIRFAQVWGRVAPDICFLTANNVSIVHHHYFFTCYLFKIANIGSHI